MHLVIRIVGVGDTVLVAVQVEVYSVVKKHGHKVRGDVEIV
jgi:hypothetical protein